MKRFLLVGSLFFAAAFIGLAMTMFLPVNVNATECNEEQRQCYTENPSDQCKNANYPNGEFDCGTEQPGGDPCSCELIACHEFPVFCL